MTVTPVAATTLAAVVTASSSVVLSNLSYLIGAVLLAIIFGLLVWLRHRKPKSIDANVESFNRGLRALAPDSSARKRGQAGARAQIAPPPRSEPVVRLRSVRIAPTRAPEAPPSPEPAGDTVAGPEVHPDGTQGTAAEAPGEHAGAEPG